MKFRRQKIEDVQINLTPLIDVVFLLLIFFMVSTTFNQSTELTIDLPQATHTAPATRDIDKVEIVITSDGQFVINGKTLINEKVNTLVAGLKEVMAGDFTIPLVITADAKSSYDMVLRVYDAAAQLGINKLAHTAKQEAAE